MAATLSVSANRRPPSSPPTGSAARLRPKTCRISRRDRFRESRWVFLRLMVISSKCLANGRRKPAGTGYCPLSGGAPAGLRRPFAPLVCADSGGEGKKRGFPAPTGGRCHRGSRASAEVTDSSRTEPAGQREGVPQAHRVVAGAGHQCLAVRTEHQRE